MTQKKIKVGEVVYRYGHAEGFLRCSEESVPKLKVKAAQLGFPPMVALLDEIADIKVSDLRELLTERIVNMK